MPLPPPALYVLPRSATDPAWASLFPAASRVAVVIAPDQGPSVEAYSLRADSVRLPLGALTPNLDYAGVARLVSASVPRAAQAGQDLTPAFAWQIGQPPAEDVKFFVHLVDSAGETWAQYDEDVYPVSEWQTGQILLVRRPLTIPATVPIGQYTLQVGLERSTGEALPARDSTGRVIGEFWQSLSFSVTRSPHPPSLATVEIARTLNVTLGQYDAEDGQRLALVGGGDRVLLAQSVTVVAPPRSSTPLGDSHPD